MKYCPTCQTQYTDLTLRYCLQDGTPLADMPGTGPLAVDAFENEAETVQRRSVPVPSESVETQWTPHEPGRASIAPRTGKSRVGLALTLSALALFLVALVGAVGLYLYFKDPEQLATNTDNSNVKSPVNNAVRTPTPGPTAMPEANNQVRNRSNNDVSSTPAPAVDKEQASQEVSELINQWKSDTETGNLDSQLGKYASSVNYYQRKGAGRNFIRADKQRAFSTFDRISMDFSNMNVSVSDSGETATAVFDKEWVFDGERRSTGKVRQQIDLRRVNGKWLITGERDLRVYYTN